MTTEGLTYIVDGETTEGLPGLEEASPFGPAGESSKPVILIHRAFLPPPLGSDGAIDPDDGVQSIGSIAVRLVARWSLPRAQMLPVPGVGGGVNPGPAPAASREEEERLRDW